MRKVKSIILLVLLLSPWQVWSESMDFNGDNYSDSISLNRTGTYTISIAKDDTKVLNEHEVTFDLEPELLQ